MTTPKRARVDCDLCGEPIRISRSGHYIDETGEFWDEERDDSLIAHAQCGLNRDLELA